MSNQKDRRTFCVQIHLNGFELMEYIHPMGIPVIFLTAKDSLKDRMQGLTVRGRGLYGKAF